jgi:hypothetical protein
VETAFGASLLVSVPLLASGVRVRLDDDEEQQHDLGIERCIGKGAAVHVHCGREFGGDWSLTTLFRELKDGANTKGYWGLDRLD